MTFDLHIPAKKASTFLIPLVSILLTFLSAGCKKENPVNQGTSQTTTFKGSIEVKYHSDANPATPLADATVQLDSLELKTDSTGSFSLMSVPFGKHKLTISYIGIVPIDTSVLINDATTTFNYIFIMYHFAGTISLKNPTNPLAVNPIQTRITLDKKYSVQTTANAPNFDFGYLIAGQHTLHIDSTTNTFSADTTFIADQNYDYGTTNDYNFYAGAPFREFVFPTAAGTSWKYQFYEKDIEYDYESLIRNGTHVWTINSSEVGSNSQTLTISDISSDTATYWNLFLEPSDSIYFVRDTVNFQIVIDNSNISINCPEYKQTIPRFDLLIGDTLTTYAPWGYFHGVYLNSVGLLSSSTYYPGTTPSWINLTLLEFTKP